MRKSSFSQSTVKQIRRLVGAILGHCGYRVSRSIKPSALPDDALFRSLAPGSSNQKFTIALVGTSNSGLSGFGKASPTLYFPKLGYAFAKRGVSLVAYRDPDDALRDIDNHDPARTAFVLVYNELFQRDEFQHFADLTSHAEFRFYNAPSAGAIIGDKRATNAAFVNAGISVPPMMRTAEVNTSKVFSNAPIGSRAATAIIDVGQPIDVDRYNTCFIDTAHDYKGKSYYVSLRALAVTGTMISAYVRLRPTGEAEASVHTIDTPKDPHLIAHFHKLLVETNRPQLIKLCKQIGDVLGPGFYCHDILPSRETGELYVCETGFKFDDGLYREWLWPISSDLPFLMDHFAIGIADLAAEVVAEQCFGRIGLTTPSDEPR
jgi:hypothetical protein